MRLWWWAGICVLALYGLVLLAVFLAYRDCADECHGALALALLFSFLVPAGAGLMRISGKAGAGQRFQLLDRALRRGVGIFGALFILIAIAALVWAVRNLVQGVSGWGLAPEGWHPNASDKMSQAVNQFVLAAFLLAVGAGCMWAAGRRNNNRRTKGIGQTE